MPAQPHRIVSLIASATEIVCALGFENQLVGRSHECDYPPGVLAYPACSAAKIDVRGTSRQIDDRVKSVLQSAASVYWVNAELLNQLEPTVVITQTQCEVCAVSLKDVEKAVCKLVSSRPALVALEPNCLNDVWNDIRRVAVTLEVPQRGEELIDTLNIRMVEVARQTLGQTSRRPTIACIEWIDPLMAAGNWVPELVEIAGGKNLFGEAGKHSPWMTWDQLVAADPEVIAVMPCGFDIPRTQSEMAVLTENSSWSRLRAVREGRVYLTDGNQYFNRPGPRLVESAEILAELLHPEFANFGHEGEGWIRMNSE
jgi:iron complex transport system substrate-binding protein